MIRHKIFVARPIVAIQFWLFPFNVLFILVWRYKLFYDSAYELSVYVYGRV